MNCISDPTKHYLLFSLNEQMKENKNETIFNSLKNYSSLYEVKNSTEQSGGFGGESMATKGRGKGKAPGIIEIGLGDTDAAGVAGAALGYGVGAATDWLSGFFGKKIGDKAMGISADTLMGSLKKRMGVGGAKFIEKLGGQLSDIGGKSFFDTQAGKIGRDAMKLSVQGAGSPWVDFELPGARPEPKYKAPEEVDPDEDLRKKVRSAKLRKQAQQLGIQP